MYLPFDLCNYCGSVIHKVTNCSRYRLDMNNPNLKYHIKNGNLRLCPKCGKIHPNNWCTNHYTFCNNCNLPGHMTSSEECPVVRCFYAVIFSIRDQLIMNSSNLKSSDLKKIKSKHDIIDWSRLNIELNFISEFFKNNFFFNFLGSFLEF